MHIHVASKRNKKIWITHEDSAPFEKSSSGRSDWSRRVASATLIGWSRRVIANVRESLHFVYKYASAGVWGARFVV